MLLARVMFALAFIFYLLTFLNWLNSMLAGAPIINSLAWLLPALVVSILYSYLKKKEKKKMRVAFLKFFDRLQSACSKLQTVDEWSGYMFELQALIGAFKGDISHGWKGTFEVAMRPIEPTLTGVRNACEVIRNDVFEYSNGLPTTAVPTMTIIGALLLGGVSFGSEALSTTLWIFNDGCDIPPLPHVALPGVEIPAEIAKYETTIAKIPPISIPFTLAGNHLTAFGTTYEIPSNAQAYFDNVNIRMLNELDFSQGREHSLLIDCRL